MVWSEPGYNSSEVASSSWTENSYGQWIYTKPRRFIVVRADELSCFVVPITSYGDRGVGKPGTKKSDHCIVHTGEFAPDPLASEKPIPPEQGMQPFAVRIDPDEKTTKLDRKSRIDFANPRTVHFHNKVKSFGMVHPDSMHALTSQFQNVMDPSREGRLAAIVRPPALESGRSHHLQAYGAMIRGGLTQEEAVQYVNAAVRAIRECRSSAELSQSESEDDRN